MKIYTALASSDWGFIYQGQQIKASNWRTAFGRAASLAKQNFRKRPKQVSITIRLVGNEKRNNTDSTT